MTSRTLRFATFLAPSVLPVYRFIADYVARQLGIQTELAVGESFSAFADGKADVGFICGLPYVLLAGHNPPPVELLAAPVLQGERYGGRPIYFSDVIVRRDSPVRSFADLRGRSWSYNDQDSQSGYGITRDRLVQLGETQGYFGSVIAAGFHQESIRLVCEGKVDASAIDSQLLAIAMRDDPSLNEQLRVIDVFGPSTIQPIVAATHLPDRLKAELRDTLLSMHADSGARERLAQGLIERFAPVTDANYDDIRRMLAAADAAGFTTLK